MTARVPRRYEWVVGDDVAGVFRLRGVDLSSGPARMVLARGRGQAALIDLDDGVGNGLTLSYVADATYQTSTGELSGDWTNIAFTFTVTAGMVGRGELFVEIGDRERAWAEWVVLERGVPA